MKKEITISVDNLPKENPFKMPGLSELISIFPESISYAKKQLKEIEDHAKEKEEKDKEILKNILTKVHMSKIEDKEFAIWFYSFIVPLMSWDPAFVRTKYWNKPYDKKSNLEKLLRMHEWKRKPADDDTITDIDIVRAKEWPITDYLQEDPNRSGFIHCPFHKEKSPSFKIYKEQNRFNCFGCGENGDCIDIVQKLYNLEFIKAVKFILKK